MDTFSAEKIFFHANKIYSYINDNEILPPSSIDIDLSGRCNCDCFFCNTKRVLDGNIQKLSHIRDVIIPAIEYLKVKSICLGGGGEPTVNPEFIKILELLNKKNFNLLVITNGILLEDLVQDMHDIKSIGVSFEAYDRESYIKIRKVDKFDKVIRGLEKVNKLKSKNNIKDNTVKILINIYNYHKIYDISKLAKDIGVDNVYIRPVGLHNLYDYKCNKQDLSKYSLQEEMIPIVHEQLYKTKELSDKNFRVFSNMVQFKDDLNTPDYEFDKCYGFLMSISFSPDGYVYICVDNRGNEIFRLCKHEDLIKEFNSDKHKQIVNKASSEFRELCPRCSKAKVNLLIQDFILKDEANRDFI